eukprot:TRINITY_DN8866_c0_g1_i1.p3 TRINITY_DN8866_c0_g1~~TRINITY_DN8866_c0_g1_i1.p3  ORF type:complete len:103 (+),score=41.30 TRINITY_DN8866_c0_g1_i1:325-633(+)
MEAELRRLLSDDAMFHQRSAAVFAEIDINKNGRIEKSEFKPAMKSVFRDVQVDLGFFEKHNLFRDLDSNKDGVLSLEEFEPLVRKLLEKLLVITTAAATNTI